MQYLWTYSGVDKQTEEEVAQQWRSRQDELDAKAEMLGGSDESPARFFLEHNDAAPNWVLLAAVYTPHGDVAAESRGNELLTVLDEITAELSQQIDQKANQPHTLSQRRRGLESIVAFLEAFHRRGASREFLSFLWPVMHSLYPYAQRELQFRRDQDQVSPGEVTASEMLDQAMLRAWEEFDQRDGKQPLQLWLIGLIDHELDRQGQPRGEVSLEDREPRPTTEVRESLKFESTERPDTFDSIELSQLIPDAPPVDSWERLDVETKRTRLNDLFQQLNRQERQVLMLSSVEGFTAEEIADFQNRSPAEVNRDLENARGIVQDKFVAQLTKR